MRLAVFCFALTVATTTAFAKEPRTLAPSTRADTPSTAEKPSIAAADHHDDRMSPEAEASARSSQGRIDEMEKRMNAKIQRATQSICTGCGGGPTSPSPKGLTGKPRHSAPTPAPTDEEESGDSDPFGAE